MIVKPTYQCCFCGSSIHPASHDPVTLTITISDPEASGASQDLRCHGNCLKERLTPGTATLMEAYGSK
jgi:hypothetical protein